MTKDELIELRRERSKQELNIGDKVIAHSASDKPLYDGKVATIIEKGIIGNEVYYGLYIEGEIVEKRSKPLMGAAGIIGTTSLLAPFYAEDLELVKELKLFAGIHPLTVEHAMREMEELKSELAANPEKAQQIIKEWEQIKSTIIKVGDKVKVNDSRCTIPEKENKPTDEIKCGDRVQTWLSKHKSADHNGNAITIPVKADLDDTYWDAYKAELASKIAVAYAEKGRFAPDEIGGFAVRVANDVVNNLKKQEQC